MRIALALQMMLLAAAPVWAQSGPPIRIGFGSAMSGPSAITGEGVMWAGTMVVGGVNAKGGILGHKVEAFFADNRGTPGEAVSAVRKLVDVDKVDVIIGQTHSGACLGALPIIKELEVPMVIESCSNPKIRELSGKGGNEWAFRVNIDDEIMAYTFARSMAKSVKSMTVVAQNDDFGRGGAAAYDAAFKKAGITLTSTEFFDRGQADYRSLLTRIKRANPEALLLIMLATDGSVFMRQFRELGLTQKLYARGSMATVEFLNQVKDNPKIGDGLVEATYWTASLDPDWEKRWLERWKTPVRVHGSMAAIAFKYAVVPAIEVAIRKYGRVDHRTIRDALEQVDVKDSPVGPIKFDDHHQAWINMILIEMRDGKLNILEKLSTSPALLK